MKKTIVTALVAAATTIALSACNVDDTTGTGSKDHPVKHKGADAPDFTVAQENAIESAQSYLDMSGFSRAGLIGQLSSKAGDGFKMADAVFAVNHVKVDWNKEPSSPRSRTWTCPASRAPGSSSSCPRRPVTSSRSRRRRTPPTTSALTQAARSEKVRHPPSRGGCRFLRALTQSAASSRRCSQSSATERTARPCGRA